MDDSSHGMHPVERWPIGFAAPPVINPAGGGDRARPTVGVVVAIAILSAVLASASTFGLVEVFGRGSLDGSSPSGSGAAQAVAAVNSSGGDLAEVVAAAKESVVTITAKGIGQSGISPFDVPATGVGSGIVVSSDGLVLTNNHVVEGAQSLTVTTSDGHEVSATVVDTDPGKDIAIIKATGGNLTAATIGASAPLEVGETVLAIGSPLGEFTETVTRGIVSALDRSITVSDDVTGAQKDLSGLIQTDAAINPGNSGGPLIDESGTVVGMNTAVSRSAEGLGFAIPIDAARSLIDKVIAAQA
jgi:S1-C subfamily serine protease